MRTFFILVILVFFISNKTTAQLLDSIQTSFQYKPKFLLKFDTRNSFVTNQYAKMKGVKMGLSYNTTTKVGIGYHWMKTELVNSNLTVENQVQLNFAYGVAFIEYSFFRSKHWNAEIPVQIGAGKSFYKNTATAQIVANSWMIIYEPAMTIEYRFLRYFGIGGGIGFRLAIKLNNEVKEKFTSPEYIFRFKIYFGDIYKEKIRKE